MSDNVIVAIFSLAVLVVFAVRAARKSAAPKTPLAAAVDAHWDLTGERPVWRGAGFVRPTKKGDKK